MSTSYEVKVGEYAEKHFIKSFKKKYQNAWDLTWQGIEEQFKRFDSLAETDIAEVICGTEKIKIAKTQFRVHNTKDSRKTSGNRCIIAVHADTRIVKVLLVYGKTDLAGSGETAKWKQMVKENYPEYRKIIT
jgi:hypothetical protein